MCRERYWSHPELVVATITPLLTLSKYLAAGLWYKGLWVAKLLLSASFVSEVWQSLLWGWYQASFDEGMHTCPEDCLHWKVGLLGGRVLSPKERAPSGDIVVIWGIELVSPIKSHTRVHLTSVDRGSAAMATKPSAVNFSVPQRKSWHQEVGGSPPRRPGSCPHHIHGSPVQREEGPAATLLQEAGSRQLRWDPFVLREACGEKQSPIIGHFIRAAAADQILTQSFSEGPPFSRFPSRACWTLFERLLYCQTSFKEKGCFYKYFS